MDSEGRITLDKGTRLLRVRLYPQAHFNAQVMQVASAVGAEAPFLVFVHGFNVNFADAVDTAARLSLRMRHKVVPVLLSWPSAGYAVMYPADGERAAKSDGALKDSIATLRAAAPARPIQLVAHSMGNRIALAALATAKPAAASAPALVEELVSVAPDVPCDAYATAASKITSDPKTVKRMSLYLYEDDYALRISKKVHFGQEACRAGNQRGTFSARVRGVETIDWSCVPKTADSHSYYVQDQFIAGDLQRIIAEHKAPNERNLNKIQSGQGFFFLHSGIEDPTRCLPPA